MILLLLGAFSSSAVLKFLVGAGLGLGTSAFMITFLNYYVDQAVGSTSALGAVAGLIGLSGLDKALSIVVGALVARVSINSLNIKLIKS
jgi:hypothetical protein